MVGPTDIDCCADSTGRSAPNMPNHSEPRASEAWGGEGRGKSTTAAAEAEACDSIKQSLKKHLQWYLVTSMNMTRIRITTYCRSKLHRTKHHYNPALHDELSVIYIKHHSISLQSSHPSAIPRSWTTSKAQLDALRQQISDQTNQPGRQRLGEYRPFIKGVCAANGT